MWNMQILVITKDPVELRQFCKKKKKKKKKKRKKITQ